LAGLERWTLSVCGTVDRQAHTVSITTATNAARTGLRHEPRAFIAAMAR
jgi:hypothetical protein